MDLRRRQHLHHLAGLGAGLALNGWGTAEGRPSPETAYWAAAWNGPDGHCVGLLARATASGRPTWRVHRQQEVPTRAHGLAALPGGLLLAVARRPGDWLLRWRPGAHAEPELFWNTDGTHFNGHVVRHPDGRHLLTTETDPDADDGLGTGIVGVRDLHTLQLVARWPTGGRDPHQLLVSPDGRQLWVANGGLASRPETGRARIAEAPMDASIVVFDLRSGERLARWTVSDPWLSLRHLAWHGPTGTLGVALQAEHPDPARRVDAPVLAWLNAGEAQPKLTLAPVPASAPMAGYGGDIVATSGGFAVSSPRSGRVALWDAQGRPQSSFELPQACALAPGPFVAGSGEMGEMGLASLERRPLPLTPDNHWVPWRA